MIASRHLTILSIIAVAALVFAVEMTRDATFSEKYGTVPSTVVSAGRAVVGGDLSLGTAQPMSRLFTSLFLHGDIEHLVLNMVFLWAFGYLTSQLLGQWSALAIFIFCGVCGNIAQIWLNPESQIPIIGASGAICGFEGVYLGLALGWHLPWPDVWPLAHPIPPLQLGAFALIGFLADVFFLTDHAQRIAFGAHVGGFLSGLAIAALVTAVFPGLVNRRSNKYR